LQVARDAEVDDLYQRAFGVHHDVVRLQIAVDNLRAVRARHAGTGFLHDLELPRERQRLLPADDVADRVAHDVFHRDERLAIEFAVFEDRDDVRVAQPAHRLRFVNETLAQGRIVEVAPDHFDRDEAVEHGILRQVKRAHPALRELSGHPILADDLRYLQ
jgi:hypothetical protein